MLPYHWIAHLALTALAGVLVLILWAHDCPTCPTGAPAKAAVVSRERVREVRVVQQAQVASAVAAAVASNLDWADTPLPQEVIDAAQP